MTFSSHIDGTPMTRICRRRSGAKTESNLLARRYENLARGSRPLAWARLAGGLFTTPEKPDSRPLRRRHAHESAGELHGAPPAPARRL